MGSIHDGACTASPPPESARVDANARSPYWVGLPGWKDGLGVGLGVLLTLAISYLFGRGRIFWEDEMLGWMLLHDPSWHHMIRAWKLGADGGGFSFYLTGRLWFRLFGASEISFRLYSGSCFAAAFAVIWFAARRFYSVGVVAFALFNTFFFSQPIVLHMAEGRFYGLLMLSTALAAALALRPPGASTREGAGLPVAAFLVHGLLVTSHLLGLVYSAFLLAPMIAMDWFRHRMRPRLYAAVAASWLLLLPERSAIVATVRSGQPHFWTTPPTVARFAGAYVAFNGAVAAALFVLALGFGVMLRSDRRHGLERLAAALQERRPVYCVAVSFLLVPIAFLLEGLFGPSLYISRYLLPVCLAQVLLTAEILALVPRRFLLPRAVWRRLPRHDALPALGSVAFAALLLFWVFHVIPPHLASPGNYTDAVSAMLPKGVPVLCEDARSFTEIIGRQHGSGVDYTYLLDWPESIAAAAPRAEVSEFHLMENWRRAGYFGGSIDYRNPFLQQYRQFFVLHAETVPRSADPPMVGNPLVARFAVDPAYTVKPYSSLLVGRTLETVWRVCRGPCPLVGELR